MENFLQILRNQIRHQKQLQQNNQILVYGRETNQKYVTEKRTRRREIDLIKPLTLTPQKIAIKNQKLIIKSRLRERRFTEAVLPDRGFDLTAA